MHYSNAALLALLPAMGMATSWRSQGSSDGQKAMSLNAVSLMSTDAHDSAPPACGNAGNAGSTGQTGCNDCGMIEKLVPNGSERPLVEDCKGLIKAIGQYAVNEEWDVTEGQHILAWYKTCAFSIGTEEGSGHHTFIGDADAKDLTQTAIDNFGKNKEMGANGKYKMYVTSVGSAMKCSDAGKVADGDKKAVEVSWSIVATPKKPEYTRYHCCAPGSKQSKVKDDDNHSHNNNQGHH